MISRKVTLGLAVAAAGLLGPTLQPKTASACADVGVCMPPEVFEPTFSMSPKLECVDIMTELGGYENDFHWDFTIENNCSSTLTASQRIFGCSTELEAGGTAQLRVRGGRDYRRRCPDDGDGGADVGYGGDDGGTNFDAGEGTMTDASASVDVGWQSPDAGDTGDAGRPDGGLPSQETFALTHDGSSYTLTYDYVLRAEYQELSEWKDDYCLSNSDCPLNDAGYGTGGSTGGSSSGGDDAGSLADSGADDGTGSDGSGSGDPEESGCSTTGSGFPVGGGLLAGFILGAGCVRRHVLS